MLIYKIDLRKRGGTVLLALDVGNTNIVIGILDGDKLIKSGRISTDIYKT